MVKKIFSFLNRESGNLHSAAYLLGSFAILSQLLAFLRDRLLAHIFGASQALDVYYAAFRIPDFIFVTVASVVSLSVLVPFIIDRDRLGKEAVREFVESVFSFFSVLIISVSVLAFLLMPYLVPVLFKGFSSEALQEVIFISRLMLVSPVALGFSNLFGSLTQAYNRFAIYALAPLLYNTGIIFGTLAFTSEFGPAGVGVGVVIGALLHAGIQVPFAVKMGLFPRPRLKFDFRLIREVAKLSVPRTLTLSTSHVAFLFLISLASLMAAGSISVLSFSFNIQSVPLAIVGVSYSLATFPTLSRHFSEKNMKAYLEQMATTARHIIFWSLPLTALFIVLRAQVVRTLLGTGRFDWSDTRLTAAALALFVASSVFQSLVLLFMRAFYSVGKTKKPFVISAISTAVLIGASYGLVKLFYASPGFGLSLARMLKVDDLGNIAVLMLPLGFSIGTAVSGILHWFAFEKEFSGFTRRVSPVLAQSLVSAGVVGVVAHLGLRVFEPVFEVTQLVGIFLQGLSAGLLGIAAGVLVLYLLKSHELAEVWRAIHAKFWKEKVIATDPEIV